MKKLFLLVLIFAVMGTTAFAADFLKFPDSIKPGTIMISPAFKLGSFYGLETSVGATVAVDYALGINFPLTVGGEVGFITVSNVSLSTIPILARAQYHPDLGVPNLDVYATLKLGFNIVMMDETGWGSASGGFAYGSNVGGRYFFSKQIGVFAELGYDYAPVSYKIDLGPYLGSWSYSEYIYTFLTLGVTFKVK